MVDLSILSRIVHILLFSPLYPFPLLLVKNYLLIFHAFVHLPFIKSRITLISISHQPEITLQIFVSYPEVKEFSYSFEILHWNVLTWGNIQRYRIGKVELICYFSSLEKTPEQSYAYLAKNYLKIVLRYNNKKWYNFIIKTQNPLLFK